MCLVPFLSSCLFYLIVSIGLIVDGALSPTANPFTYAPWVGMLQAQSEYGHSSIPVMEAMEYGTNMTAVMEQIGKWGQR